MKLHPIFRVHPQTNQALGKKIYGDGEEVFIEKKLNNIKEKEKEKEKDRASELGN